MSQARKKKKKLFTSTMLESAFILYMYIVHCLVQFYKYFKVDTVLHNPRFDMGSEEPHYHSM